MIATQHPDHADYSQLRTVIDFIRWGASQMRRAGLFFGHGTDNAIDEAASLVLHALQLPPDLDTAYFAARLTNSEKAACAALVQTRIETRTPAPYLIGEAWFFGLPFNVDERVLIPRSPIAELIEAQFMPWVSAPDKVNSILDLCTGSGCIGIACGYAFEAGKVDLSDISDGALAVAQGNIDRHLLADRITLIKADLFCDLGSKRYDLIVSNPPYVDTQEMTTLPSEYSHEPALALAAGDDGLDCVRRILRDARRHLTDQGVLVVEDGNAQAAVIREFPHLDFYWPNFERGGDGVFILTAEQLDEPDRPV